MSNFIFISKIDGSGDDYDNIKISFNTFSGNDGSNINEVNGYPLRAVYYSQSDILLINGGNFKDYSNFITESDSINKKTYEQLIENIKKVYSQIKEDHKSENLDDFQNVFDPQNTTICIHWGGSGNKNEIINKVVEDIRKVEKINEVFSITYFSGQDKNAYNNLISKDITRIKHALEFYAFRADNLLVKKKIYELMEAIFIYGFDFFLQKSSKQFSIEKTKDENFFNTISSDIKFLDKEKDYIYHQNTKKAIDNFYTQLKKEVDKNILIHNIQTFRSDTYDLLNQIEGPIYPKAL